MDRAKKISEKDIAKQTTGQATRQATRQAICSATAVIDNQEKSLSVKLSDGLVVNALMLQTGLPLVLNDGDTVLVSMPGAPDELPIVLGRVAEYAETITPADLCIEAENSLTLKCGQGNVTLKHDKVLVKGKEVVSRAKGANQIKGGSVSIN